jgi:hypothetical protein
MLCKEHGGKESPLEMGIDLTSCWLGLLLERLVSFIAVVDLCRVVKFVTISNAEDL